MSNLIVDGPVRKVLNAAGWRFLGRKQTETYEERVARLREVLDALYVDNRRRAAVNHLEEARRIAGSL